MTHGICRILCLHSVLLLLGLRLVVFSDDLSPTAADASPKVFSSNLKWEEQVLAQVNRLRAEKGLGQLKLNPRAQTAARNHSIDMAKRGYFSHRDLQGGLVDERLRQAHLGPWKGIAENIAKCDASANPTQQAVVGWTKSPGHAKNMFNPDYNETGIAAVLDRDGYVLFCQVFVVR